jgi:hypothetical protein
MAQAPKRFAQVHVGASALPQCERRWTMTASVSHRDESKKGTQKKAMPTGTINYSISWPSPPLPIEIYKSVLRLVAESRSYALLTREQAAEHAHKLAQKFAYNITPALFAALYRVCIKDKITRNWRRMKDTAEVLYREYERGENIVTIAHAADLPPSSLLREMWTAVGVYPRPVLKSVFLGRTDPHSVLNIRDAEQFELAQQYDADSSLNQMRGHQVALANEHRFADFLEICGLQFETEGQILARQRDDGEKLITPDILLAAPIRINGSPVYWIDYKDYVGTRAWFLLDSNRKQAAKYAKKWGPGAICYRHGFTADMRVEGAILLSCTHIELPFADL